MKNYRKMLMAPLVLLTLMQTIASAENIPLERHGGVLTVKVTINGRLTIDCILDSGAADVSIPADVLLTLVRTGTVTKADRLPPANYTIADGSTVTQQRYLLRSVRVGSAEVFDVTAGISNLDGPLLLGQAFLARLPSWKIDNQKAALVINESGLGKGTDERSFPGSSGGRGDGGDSPICLPNCNDLHSDKEIFSCLLACAALRR